MSGLAHLRSLAQGVRPADDGLLGNARCHWAGTELLSEEAILAEFTAQPFCLEGELQEVETAQCAALIGGDRALYADIYDGRIGRLWRIGGAPALPPAPAVDVPFDADMRQERGDMSFRAEDHPCLDAAGAERVLEASRELLDDLRHQGNLRVRGFVIRAFGHGEASAALVALYAMTNTLSRSASFSFAVIGTGSVSEEARIVREQLQPRQWTPRL